MIFPQCLTNSSYWFKLIIYLFKYIIFADSTIPPTMMIIYGTCLTSEMKIFSYGEDLSCLDFMPINLKCSFLSCHEKMK